MGTVSGVFCIIFSSTAFAFMRPATGRFFWLNYLCRRILCFLFNSFMSGGYMTGLTVSFSSYFAFIMSGVEMTGYAILNIFFLGFTWSSLILYKSSMNGAWTWRARASVMNIHHVATSETQRVLSPVYLGMSMNSYGSYSFCFYILAKRFEGCSLTLLDCGGVFEGIERFPLKDHLHIEKTRVFVPFWHKNMCFGKHFLCQKGTFFVPKTYVSSFKDP